MPAQHPPSPLTPPTPPIMQPPRTPPCPTLTLDALSVEVDLGANLITIAWEDRELLNVVIPALGARGKDAAFWLRDPLGDLPGDQPPTSQTPGSPVVVGAWEYKVTGWTPQHQWRRLQVRPLPRFSIQVGARVLQVEQFMDIPGIIKPIVPGSHSSRAGRYRSLHAVLEVVEDVDGNLVCEFPYRYRFSILGHDHGCDVWAKATSDLERSFLGDLAAEDLSFPDAVNFVAAQYASGAAEQDAT